MDNLIKLQEIKLEIRTHKDEYGQLIFDNNNEWLLTLNQIKEFIKDLDVDENNYKSAKKVRATLNNEAKALTSVKTSFLKDYVNDYEIKSKEITSLVKEISEIVDSKVYEYEKSIGTAKPKIITITFKTYDQELANKLLAQGEELGIKGEIK